MQVKVHTTPAGAVFRFKRYGIADLIDIEFIRLNVPKEVMSIYRDPEHVGRKLNLMAHATGAAILRSAFKIIADELLESNRLNLPYGRQLFIGALSHNPLRKKIKYRNVERNLNLRTNGVVFGMQMTGTKKNYYFRMPSPRRMELRNRIYAGQWFNGRV